MLRGLPSALALIAVTMQVAAPVLHEQHADHAPVAVEDGLHAATCGHEDAPSAHDPESCSQCRQLSQLKSFCRFQQLGAAADVRSLWTEFDRSPGAWTRIARDESAPRAPPLFV